MSSAGSSSTPAPQATPVKRACDSCHRRKVKCSGEGQKPCKNCQSAGLTCTYNAIPQKKGPKGSRAKVLSELRETQRQSQLSVGSGSAESPGGRAVSPSLTKTPGLVSKELMEYCADHYFQTLYPIQPILHRGRVQQAILASDQSIEAYCKMCSLCAYILLHQPHIVIPPHLAIHGEAGQIPNQNLGHLLLDECIRVRKGYDFYENTTILTIYTSFFISCSYLCLDKQNISWAYLRQAMTLAYIMGMHVEDTYKMEDPIDSSRKRRLFWMLFITDRAYALKGHRPLTLYATINTPAQEDDPTDAVPIKSFCQLINLYKPFDDTFFGVWNKMRLEVVPSWLAQLQHQLAEALPTYIEGTEIQVLELRTSQQWLKIMVWQLAISHGFISSLAPDNTMSFKYPAEISRELVDMAAQFSQQALEIHGIGFIEKIFDVACTLVDVMAYVPIEQQTLGFDPRDYLNRFISLMSTLRAGQARYLPLLLNKIHDALPGYTLPEISRALPYGSGSQSNLRIEDMYESGLKYESASSNPTSHDATPYDSPPTVGGPIPLRHGSAASSMHSGIQHYGEHLTPNLGGQQPSMGAPPYPGFSTTIGYPEIQTVSTAPAPTGGLFQSHLPRQGQGFGE